jgi:Flp pilus assembly protein TadD
MHQDPRQKGGDLYFRGATLLRAGDAEAAVPVLLEAFELDPHPATARKLAAAFEHLGRQPEADQYWAAAYSLAPNNDAVAVGYAGALVRGGDTLRAREVLAAVLRRNDSYGPAQRLLDQIKERPGTGEQDPR